jgi:hypothetical protein
MSKTVEIPDGFRERTPGGRFGTPTRPMVSVDAYNIRLLVAAYEAMGEPEAVRCFVNGDRVALIPADTEHPNAYPVYNRHKIAGTWLQQELDRDTQPEGRFPLERDGDLWVVDFAPEGDDHGEPGRGTASRVGSTLRSQASARQRASRR